VGEVGGVDESVGDAFEDAEFVVGAFEAAVGDPFGVVEGEDLVAPVEERSDDLFELGEGRVVVGGDELAERLVGLFVVWGEVDAVELLVETPGVRLNRPGFGGGSDP